MKLLAPLFFATALAWGTKRQASGVTTISNALDAVTAATQKLGTAIRAFDGKVNSALAVNGAAGDVLKALQQGTTDVNAASDISASEALTLVKPTNNLNDAVKATTQSLIEKKPLFDANGFTQAVINTLLSQQKASTAFSAAVVSKVPTGLQTIAGNLAKPAAAALAAAIAAFQSGSSGSTSSAAAGGGGMGGGMTPTTTMAGGSPMTTPVGSMVSNIPSQMPTNTMPAPAATSPMPYTGAAALPTAAVGYGAFAAAAVAVLAF